ncbi:MAG TPA: ion channel [Edaphobacter sp.]|nr:ion channel [Edaphobacter sp.]
MTPQQGRKIIWLFWGAIVAIVFFVLGLIVYRLMHPGKRQVLLMFIGVVLGPALLAFLLSKADFRTVLEPTKPIAPASITSALFRSPMSVITFPLVLMAAPWGLLPAVVGTKKGQDMKAWAIEHSALVILWGLTPQVVLAYWFLVLNARYIGMYMAVCLVYLTVTTAVGGLNLENGVVKFFGTYKAQASPLVILSLALLCSASFGVLHFAVWSIWPSEYANMHGIQDSLYFSAVTMATVGYGDILPVGHAARWLCIAEIVSGVLLLVVGVSASMTIWLQKNQPSSVNDGNTPKEAPTLQRDESSHTAEPT